MRKRTHHKWLLVLTLALLALSPLSAAADDASDCRQSQPDRRIVACSELIKRGGGGLGLATAYNNRGLAHQAKNNLDQAIADYSAAIRTDPKFAPAYNNRGWALNEKKEHDQAVADFDQAIRLDPKLAYAYNNRGNAHRGKKDLDRAIADYTEAIRLDTNYTFAYNNRGNAYRDKRDYDRAIADYATALRLDHKFLRALMNRGEAFAAKGQAALALADFRKAVDLTPSSASDRQLQETARERIARLAQPRPQPATMRRVALVIGNSGYAHVGALSNPRNDARAVAAALGRLGFAHVMERYDLNRETMGKALKDFGDQAAGSEWALVYFAGPVDAELKRDTHVPDETVALDRVQAKVDAASKLGLVVLDACRNNPFIARMNRSRATRSLGRGLANVEPEGNVLVAYAAKHGTVAEDGAHTNSPFTQALLAHIEEPGLEINILFRKVRDLVRKSTNGRQDPFVYGSLGSELLYFKPELARASHLRRQNNKKMAAIDIVDGSSTGARAPMTWLLLR